MKLELDSSGSGLIKEFAGSGIQVLNGRYGPYIKFDGKNFRLSRGINPETLTEEKCREIISAPASAKKTSYKARFKK